MSNLRAQTRRRRQSRLGAEVAASSRTVGDCALAKSEPRNFDRSHWQGEPQAELVGPRGNGRNLNSEGWRRCWAGAQRWLISAY
eukprot:1155396-Rhodomonas_salina.1